MHHNNPSIQAAIDGEEHRPEYAVNNARALIEMTESATATLELDYDGLRIENNFSLDSYGFRGHYFVIEEDGEIYTEPVYNSIDVDEYDPNQEVDKLNKELDWETNMPLTDFEQVLDDIAMDHEKKLHGISKGQSYRLESSSPAGMMGGFGGPNPVPQSYGDARMYISDKENEFKALFHGAPNSGAEIAPSVWERTKAGLMSKVSDKNRDDILIESHQSGKEPYAELEFIESSGWGEGTEPIETSQLEQIAENAEGFDVEVI